MEFDNDLTESTVKVDLSSVLDKSGKEAEIEKASRIAGRVLSACFWWFSGVVSCWWLFQWGNS